MQPNPSEIQKLTERVEALEKKVMEWQIRYEEQKRNGLIFAGAMAVFAILFALAKR